MKICKSDTRLLWPGEANRCLLTQLSTGPDLLLAHEILLDLESLSVRIYLSNLCGIITAWDAPLEKAGNLKCHIWLFFLNFMLWGFFVSDYLC